MVVASQPVALMRLCYGHDINDRTREKCYPCLRNNP
jgi:hypothetical protein